MRRLLPLCLLVGCGEVLKVEPKTPACGDSVVDVGEDCDDGAATATCNADCTAARCGDGNHNALAGEECDDGNAENLDACSNACTVKPLPFTSTGADGAFEPTESTTIAGGVYNYTTINIPEGVVITVDNGVAELRATGAVVINGTIDVSGGRGGDGVSVNLGNCYAAGGVGGGGGTLVDGTPGVACATAPLPGGFGTPGGNGGYSTCVAYGGAFGGGAGGGTCAAGGGGGGFAGGGGGAGYNTSGGGAGATAYGGAGGAGGVANTDQNGVGKTAGGGGGGIGAYAGSAGTFASGCAIVPGGTTGTNPGTSGGGGAIGALATSDLAAEQTFQPGSGGGGGGGQCGQCYHGTGGGGGGGGAVRIASSMSITVGPTGLIRADGGAGGNPSTGYPGSGGGGGGSGGLIYLSAPALDVQAGAKISAVGGAGALAYPTGCGGGGAGGLGRIRISATEASCTLAGELNPPLAAGCAPANELEKTYVAAYPD